MDKIPASFVEYTDLLPSLKETTSWELLRQWSLSEVWRVGKQGGDSLIIKKGIEENSREVAVYNHVLIPLELDIPTIYEAYEDKAIGLLIMRDLKGKTLEHDPQHKYFVEAAKTLAKTRNKARLGIIEGKLTEESYLANYVSKEDIIDDLKYISQQSEYIDTGQDVVLEKALNVLPYQVGQLYENFPITLTHNDYHAKNIIKNNGGIAVIDWASAYLSPHLGDLYCLISSAKDYDITPTDLIYAYWEEIDDDWSCDMEWQINIGGICWIIHELRQLLDYGIKAIPVAHEWIPEMIYDIRQLLGDL
ncbi:Phosphotransferase enzyme family protein [Gracilibacillus orientalis]|uniref:Phosphotransferase enzyme family protein n=1 Tax=Gracilibacillus orientalis TaxID=334253 RepID=A0A1I4LI95_9BACI|nr:phosphotransferase [Gracilibacillus orientalis]SFL90692.1 Phosphotransferase enzyme family protein [Gracilibacillus orientalis]